MPREQPLPEPRDFHDDAAKDALELSYDRATLIADYGRAGAGLVLTAVPLLAMNPSAPVTFGLAALLALFGAFLAQTWQRQHSLVRLSPHGVTILARAERQLTWRDLDGLRLRWFGWRPQGKGWLELELHGNGERLVMTSALSRFDLVVAEAVSAARRNGLSLEPATLVNIEILLKAKR